MPGLEGTTFGHYRLQRRLGRGGMSEVYLATDESTQRDVAIKLVSSSHTEYSERFRHEIETMRKLTHSHILPVLVSGEHGPWHYLVTPYIRQGTLHDRLRRGSLTLQEAGNILEQVVSALQFAHDHGIIHRDIKPSNILLLDGHVYLADFGLAKAIEGDNEITQTNCLMGTPEYLAPELMDGPATTKSDIYALGILLYEMVVGRVPFKASTPVGVCWKHLHEQPVPPSQLNSIITPPIEQVILCALEKDPRSRFKSATALVQAYQKSLEVGEQRAVARVLAQSATFPTLKKFKLAAGDILSHQEIPPKQLSRSSKTHRLLAVFTLFIFLLTTSLSLGLYVASDGLRVQFSTIIGSKSPLLSRSRIQQKPIAPTFNLTQHHFEGIITQQDLPRVKKPHGRGNNDRGNNARKPLKSFVNPNRSSDKDRNNPPPSSDRKDKKDKGGEDGGD